MRRAHRGSISILALLTILGSAGLASADRPAVPKPVRTAIRADARPSWLYGKLVRPSVRIERVVKTSKQTATVTAGIYGKGGGWLPGLARARVKQAEATFEVNTLHGTATRVGQWNQLMYGLPPAASTASGGRQAPGARPAGSPAPASP